MSKMIMLVMGAGLILFLTPTLFAQKDKGNCQDHPMFTRMKEYYINDCE